MSEPLIIWLPEDLDEAWAYYKSADSQGWAANDEERKQLSKLDASGCHVVCPGTWFRVFPHALPEMKASERISAAGFAIEEKLAAPLDEQHIVLGQGDDQRVGVISKPLMSNLMDRMDELGIVPSSLLAEYEAFSSDAGSLTSWSRSIHPGPMGYSMDAASEGENPLSLAPQMQFEGALNYAQGGFIRRKSSGFGARHMAALAATLALAFFTWIGWQWADGRAMNAQAADLRAETSRLYTEATGRPAPPNLRRTIERQIKSGGGPKSDFTTLSAVFFDGVKGIDKVYVESMRYNETRGALIVKMVYPSFETAGQLEQAFAAGPAQFQPGAVREQRGKLIGEGQLTMGQSQ